MNRNAVPPRCGLWPLCALGACVEKLFVLAAILSSFVALTASAQTEELVFDAAEGAFPSERGWVHYSEDVAPLDGLDESNLRLRGGALLQGPTGGLERDDGNYQWHEIAGLDFDFDTDQLEITLRLRILESTQAGGPKPKAGFGVRIADRKGERLTLFLGESEVFLVGERPEEIRRVTVGTKSQVRAYALQIDPNGALFRIDDVPRLRIPRNDFEASRERNAVIIGDITRMARGTFLIEQMTFRRSPIGTSKITP